MENLLSATRIEDGRMQLRTSPEVLSDIVEEALMHVRRKAGKYHISVVSEEELLVVKVDARLIIQVLINLLDNALKYTEEGSDIIVTVRKYSTNMAEVAVADNGPGISEEEKAEIFGKFYRGENKIADNRRSLGLGLYLCKSIVEAHGGEIRVEDHVPRGSVFSFTLPLEEVSLHE